MDKYVTEVAKEIYLLSQKYPGFLITTAYLGGGTPSLLSLENIEKITNSLYTNFNCKLEEFTIEVNPNSSQNIPYYKNYGIDRISVGVQSLDDNILKKIGRLHNSAQAVACLDTACNNYDNVSGDLILGINENQNVITDVQILTKYVKHISTYMLKVEDGTLLQKQIFSKNVSIATEDSTVSQYEQIYEFCRQNNFHRYETSNFALKGYEGKHNSHYWDMTDYIGVGAGSHSFINGVRYYNKADIEAYINGEHSGNGKQITEREYSYNDTLEEYIMLALRTVKGLNIAAFNKKFNIDFLSEYKEKIKKVAQYTTIENDCFCIKPQYFLVQNSIISELL